jgi:uncharacterized protein (TIGR00251 family)
VGRLQVRVQPRARRDEIAGEREGRLLVRVTAAPVEGKANEAVRRLLAKRLGVAPGRVAVGRGQASRDKLIEVEGIDDDELVRRLRAADA